MTTQLLQNIKQVEYIEARYLANIVLIGNDKVSLKYWRNFNKVCLVDLAGVDVSQAVENGSRITTVKLSAQIADDFTVDNRRLAWRVTTVEGEQYLIGTNEQPYPVTTVANAFPSKTTERSGKTITATWKTSLDLLHIVD